MTMPSNEGQGPKSQGPSKALLPTTLAALRALSLRDGMTQLAAVILGFSLLFHFTLAREFSVHPPFFRVATALATLLMLVASLANRDRVDQREAPFWLRISWAVGQLAAVALLRVVIHTLDLPTSSDLYHLLFVSAEMLRTGGLIAMLLAVHSRPHESSRQKLAHYERSATLPTALLLAFGAVLYFGVVPVIHDGNLSRLGLVLSLGLLPLNVYLVLRLFFWVARTPQPRWQAIYFFFGLSLTIFPLSLLRLSTGRLGVDLSFVGEMAACMLAILAIRLRHFRFPVIWQREEIAHPAEARINPGSRSLLLATLAPILHLLGYRLDLFEGSLRVAREQMLIVWMLVAALASAAQHRRARKLAAELVAERRRIEASLLRSERDLKLAEERRQSDDAVLRSREKYQRAFRSSPYALVITAIEDGCHLEVNDRYMEMTGYSREELINHSTLELGIWHLPEERQAFLAELSEKGRVADFDMTFRLRDGRLHLATVNGEKLELQGKPGLLAIARDRTLDEQRVQQRQALIEVFLGSKTPILALDDDQKLVAANAAAARLLGYSPQESIEGKRLAEVLPDRALLARLAATQVEAFERGSAYADATLVDDQGRRREYMIWLLESVERNMPTAFLMLFIERDPAT